MALKEFCQHCGQGTEYSLTAPKFCGHCGQAFGAIATANSRPASLPVQTRPAPAPAPQQHAAGTRVIYDPRQLYRQQEEPETDELIVPEKLEVEISLPPEERRVTFGEVFGSDPNGKVMKRPVERLSKKARKEKVNTFLDSLKPKKAQK